jgi:hypothetical protein
MMKIADNPSSRKMNSNMGMMNLSGSQGIEETD